MVPKKVRGCTTVGCWFRYMYRHVGRLEVEVEVEVCDKNGVVVVVVVVVVLMKGKSEELFYQVPEN